MGKFDRRRNWRNVKLVLQQHCIVQNGTTSGFPVTQEVVKLRSGRIDLKDPTRIPG